MEQFLASHQSQLQSLNIPDVLFEGLKRQLEFAFSGNGLATENLLETTDRILKDPELLQPTNYGSIIVLPHICSWDILMNPHRGLLDALNSLPIAVLQGIGKGLKEADDEDTTCWITEDREFLLDAILQSNIWSRIILFRRNDSVMAALPAPPYFPPVQLSCASDTAEADLTGPFPFVYHLPEKSEDTIDVSLVYLSPGIDLTNGYLPTIDLVPLYSCPNAFTRAVRLVAFFKQKAPNSCLAQVKEFHANFVKEMHLLRQQMLEKRADYTNGTETPDVSSDQEIDQVLRVYTDANDPMKLGDPESGLSKELYTMTTSLEDADIIYSYHSLFSPGDLKAAIDRRALSNSAPFINQFPFEGALVQKDHLGREILRQHGLPRPSWAIETYDLDVQLAHFIGAAILAEERGESPLWIVKPARGTRSQGHVVTSSIAQILRLVDAGGESRVVQRYISNPVCVDGRKVDCRCIVMMTSATPGHPSLYMHKTFYFRIANKPHKIETSLDLLDNEAVLTAAHLFDDAQRTSTNPLRTLPIDHKTIAHLESSYTDKGFDWDAKILPAIKQMIIELFSGMTEAFPAMNESKNSRALYGLDIMFEIQDDGSVQPKLTEVTFCPSNNTICSSYEMDEDLRNSYCTDIFNCLFKGIVSHRIDKIQ